MPGCSYATGGYNPVIISLIQRHPWLSLVPRRESLGTRLLKPRLQLRLRLAYFSRLFYSYAFSTQYKTSRISDRKAGFKAPLGSREVCVLSSKVSSFQGESNDMGH